MDAPKPNRHRRSIRLPSFDYANSRFYFITLVCDSRQVLFGDVVSGTTDLSDLGKLAEEELLFVPGIRKEIAIDAYVIMPNHLHAVVEIRKVDAQESPSTGSKRPATGPTPRSLSGMVAGYKAAVTRRWRAEIGNPDVIVWQRNFYEHVVRDQEDYRAILAYIDDNPRRWSEDSENPNCDFGNT